MRNIVAICMFSIVAITVYAQNRPAPGSWFVTVVIKDIDLSSGGVPVYNSYNRWPYADQSSAMEAAKEFTKEGICIPQEALLDPEATVWCYPASSIVRTVVRKAL